MGRLSEILDVLNFKTLYFNFKYLPVRRAVRFPILISRHCRVRKAGGTVEILAPVHFGMIRFGMDGVGIFDNRRSRSIWQVEGKLIFEGRAFIGHGCKISVARGGELRLGDNLKITAESAIAATNKIHIGANCLLSWNILIMDTDWHSVLDQNENIINPALPVQIDDHVWIGCEVTILKGVSIASGCIVAAGTIVSKSVADPNCIIGKNPNEILKRNIQWRA